MQSIHWSTIGPSPDVTVSDTLPRALPSRVLSPEWLSCLIADSADCESWTNIQTLYDPLESLLCRRTGIFLKLVSSSLMLDRPHFLNDLLLARYHRISVAVVKM